MAKRKGVQPPKPKPPTNAEWIAFIPTVRENFAREITQMCDEVEPELWQNPGICGLMYEFLPWHEHSSIAIQLRDDDPTDPPSWANYECVDPNGTNIEDEIAMYTSSPSDLVYHRLLVEAAEALLSINFSDFGQSETMEDGYLYCPFRLQVYHGDEKFRFNYCEYVLARRLDQ
ncbi:hypothetical protein [Aporhodopirellula aestuarii]|uniref:YubB ferredoxin-like domain-containing protein n=1 Tax=Aporhodopirellula aestuarii TaxID=2950107 RepID=A0ABT0TY21_9BACT|nr:hypothetical protein [Aporhodopirellula aestuarii]MCM2369371.1 hypothetical protein [Aporhodopirellula aestuarii]